MKARVFFNQILEDLDNFFDSQKEQEQKLFFFLPVLLFGFLSYYFVYPLTDEDYNMVVEKQEKLVNDITKTETDRDKLHSRNNRLKIFIKKLDKELVKLSARKLELEKSLEGLSFFKFNLDKWAIIYNQIPEIAKQNNLNILSLDNNLLDPVEDLEQSKIALKQQNASIKDTLYWYGSTMDKNKKKALSKEIMQNIKKMGALDTQIKTLKNKPFTKIMQIKIKLSGNFIDFVKFLHSFEDRKEFIKIKSLSISRNEMEVSIIIYGAEI